MAKLVLSLDGNIINEYPLDKEIITIGRKADNDIHIDNLSVSGYHAKILTILNDSFIEDLESTNGTLVSKKKISKHAIVDNDVIGIGNHELKYINDNTAKEGEFEKTTVVSPYATAMKKTSEASLAPASTSSVNLDHAKLKLLSGENNGKELPLTKTLTTVGSPDVQVAAISRRPAGYFLIVIDAGKNNKMPQVNGEEINQQQVLVDGDIIDVGGVKMGFLLT